LPPGENLAVLTVLWWAREGETTKKASCPLKYFSAGKRLLKTFQYSLDFDQSTSNRINMTPGFSEGCPQSAIATVLP
jgi:hypothetical protein